MSFANILASLSLASLLGAVAGASPYSPYAAAQEQEEKPKVDYSKPGEETILVPIGVDLLEEKTMPWMLINIDQARADTRMAQGIRQFATPIEPGQTLTLSLKATPMVNYSMNWVLPSDKNDPMYSKIKLAIDNQLTRKSPAISLKNTAKERCLVLFVVHGMAEQPYSVTIKRK